LARRTTERTLQNRPKELRRLGEKRPGVSACGPNYESERWGRDSLINRGETVHVRPLPQELFLSARKIGPKLKKGEKT